MECAFFACPKSANSTAASLIATSSTRTNIKISSVTSRQNANFSLQSVRQVFFFIKVRIKKQNQWVLGKRSAALLKMKQQEAEVFYGSEHYPY